MSKWNHPQRPPPPSHQRWLGCAMSEPILIAHTGNAKSERIDAGKVCEGFYLYPDKNGPEIIGSYHEKDGRQMQVRAIAWQRMPSFPTKTVQILGNGESVYEWNLK